MLDIVASYHCMQLQGKLMNETWENGKKCIFNRDFAHLAQIRASIFFQKPDVMVSYHHVQYQKKLMI